jgi:hypothetical protein
LPDVPTPERNHDEDTRFTIAYDYHEPNKTRRVQGGDPPVSHRRPSKILIKKMNLFGKQKSFDGQFIEMLEDLKLSEKERSAMLDLPQDRKELLLQNHLKEKRPSFWSRMNTKKTQRIVNPEKVNQDFINLITKMNVSPHEMTQLVQYSLEQRYEFLMSHVQRSNTSLSTSSELKPEISIPSRSTSFDAQDMNHKWLTEQIMNRTTALKSVLRHLHCLRVLLQNSPAIIDSYLENQEGVKALEVIMDRLSSSTYDSTRSYADQVSDDEMKLEILAILDLILEVEKGSQLFVSFPSLVKHLVYCFGLPSEEAQIQIRKDKQARKQRLEVLAMVAKSLAPISYRDSVFTEYLVTLFQELKQFDREPFVFALLVSSLVSPTYFKVGIDSIYRIPLDEWNEVWNARSNLMGLFNAMIVSYDDLAKRNHMRNLLERAGLRSMLRVLSFQNPPLEFMVQLNEYNQNRVKDLPSNAPEKPLDVGYTCFM